jgi:predicted enzyme related to lactoylglutathione lyase
MVDCVRLYVSDLEAGLSFYRDCLGLESVWRTDQAIGLKMPNDATEIVIHIERKKPEIDLKIENTDDAATFIEKGGGKVVVQPFDVQIGRAAVIQDPWENELVLVDSTKGLLKTDSDGNVIGNESRFE